MASKASGAKVPVALPKSNDGTGSGAASPSPVSLDSALYGAIGARVRISTAAGATVEGTIYTADPITSLLILQTGSSSSSSITPGTLSAPAGAYRVLPISQLASFTIIAPAPATSQTETPTVINVDTAAVTQRLASAITSTQQALARQGPKGTSATDQALFDALSRTHPARWEGSSMVISDSFVLEKPYSAANTTYYSGSSSQSGGTANGSNSATGGFKGDLERFRRVVDIEVGKAHLRADKTRLDARATSAGFGERKGG